MLYKDACNMKSNQQNLGTIKCSNLCTEIIEYTAPDEVAVCNLASIVLPKFVSPITDVSADLPLNAVVYNIPSGALEREEKGKGEGKGEEKGDGVGGAVGGYVFDHQRLYEVTKVITKNLNKIIDINYYPVPEARNSNMRHRPIGMGVQGLADAFQLMKLPFDSPEARRLNVDIFETIYYAALDASCELAAVKGTYESYPGSPVSKGTTYHTIPHYTVLYYTTLNYTIPHYTVLYYTIPHYTILYYTILYYTILYYTILYHTTLYYTILH